MFARRTSERPQCVLQPFGQCNEALTAEHHLGMLPAGERQSEVIQPVCEPNAGYRDTEQVGISEVRQALLPRRMLLAEDHVAVRAMQCLPRPHPTLQRAPCCGGEVAMATQHLGHDADGAQAGRRLQHGDDLAVPDRRQRVRPSAPARHLHLRGQPGIGVNPSAGRGTEARLGGGSFTRVG